MGPDPVFGKQCLDPKVAWKCTQIPPKNAPKSLKNRLCGESHAGVVWFAYLGTKWWPLLVQFKCAPTGNRLAPLNIPTHSCSANLRHQSGPQILISSREWERGVGLALHWTLAEQWMFTNIWVESVEKVKTVDLSLPEPFEVSRAADMG